MGLLVPLAITIGANLLLSALTPKKKVEGQKLADRNAPRSNYNEPIPIIFGSDGGIRLGSNLIWALPYTEVREVEEQSGGKGGGGGTEVETFTYFATFANLYAFAGYTDDGMTAADGAEYELEEIIANDMVWWDSGGTTNPGNSSLFTFYSGRFDQSVDPDILLDYADASAYPGFCYIKFVDLPLADFGNTIPVMQIRLRRINSSLSSNTTGLYEFMKLMGKFQSQSLTTNNYPDISNLIITATLQDDTVRAYVLNGSGTTWESTFNELAQRDLAGKFNNFSEVLTGSSPYRLAVGSLDTVGYEQGAIIDDSMTIAEEEMSARTEDDPIPDKLVSIAAKDISDLPTSISVSYFDEDKQYERNQIGIPHASMNAQSTRDNIEILDMNFVFREWEAQGVSQRVTGQAYNRQRSFTFTVSPLLYGKIRQLQILRIPVDKLGNSVLVQVQQFRLGADFTTEVEAAFFKTSDVVAADSTTVPVPVETPARNTPITTPLVCWESVEGTLTDISQPFGVYVNGTIEPNAPFKLFYRLDAGAWQASINPDGGSSIFLTNIGYTGTVTAVVPNEDATDGIIDNETIITVQFTNGDPLLEVISDSDFNQKRRNLIWIDRELICFKTPTFIGSNTYELTTLWRGLRNTSTFVSDPKVGDVANLYSFVGGTQFVFIRDSAAIGKTVEVSAVTTEDPDLGDIVNCGVYEGIAAKLPAPKLRKFGLVDGSVRLQWSPVSLFPDYQGTNAQQAATYPQTYRVDFTGGLGSITVSNPQTEIVLTPTEVITAGDATVTAVNSFLDGYTSNSITV